MIKFLPDTIFDINKYFSYSYTDADKVICNVYGQTKVLYCDIKILKEFLDYVKSELLFSEIRNRFKERYSDMEIHNFISVLLKEEIIKLKDIKLSKKVNKVLLIGNGPFDKLNFNGHVVSTELFLNDYNDYDFAVIVDENLTYNKLELLNRKLYDLGKIYTQIKCEGNSVVLGPLVIPKKTACLECCVAQMLKKINKKLHEEKLTEIDLQDINYTYQFPEIIENNRLSYFLEYITNDINNFYIGNKVNLLDTQIAFDIISMNTIKSEVFPTTSCNFCRAFNSNYIKFDPKNMDLNKLLSNYNKSNNLNLVDSQIQYMTGGLRSKNADETKKILHQDLEKLKVKISIDPAIGNPFHDKGIITCFNSRIETDNNLSNNYLIRKNDGAGKGITKEQAYFSSAFELIEHTCLQYRGDIPIISAKYKDVKDYAIDMKLFWETIKNTETFFDNFNEELEMDWVIATSINNSSLILVPASFVFMYDVDVKGTFFGATSNGAAAGTTLEDAILHGLLEAVERDAWIIGQSNPYILPIVDYSSIKKNEILDVISKIKNLGYDILTRDYTNDIGIPVYRTWIVDKNNYSKYAYMGLGCHISPEIALERSITEAVQIDDWSETGGEVDSDMIDLSVLSNSLINIYNQHYLVNKDVFGESKYKSEIKNDSESMTSTFSAIKKIVSLIKEKTGADVYFVDLSVSDINTKVVRVIVPGNFQIMNIPLISVCDRLVEFGKNLGYSDKNVKYEKLFMGKYQH